MSTQWEATKRQFWREIGGFTDETPSPATSRAPLVLSLFPGIGFLDRAFEEEGFCIVRGPDLIWGGDIRGFHPPAGVFDGVIGGPPCQAFSQLRHLVEANGFQSRFGNLIPEFERVVAEAQPAWFVMENVAAAPIPVVPGYHTQSLTLRDCELGGATMRERRVSFGSNDGRCFDVPTLALWSPDAQKAVLGDQRQVPVAIGGSGKRKPGTGGRSHDGPRMDLAAMLVAQGFPPDLLDDSPLTMDGKRKAVGNGVPLAMGRAIARAVKAALAP